MPAGSRRCESDASQRFNHDANEHDLMTESTYEHAGCSPAVTAVLHGRRHENRDVVISLCDVRRGGGGDAGIDAERRIPVLATGDVRTGNVRERGPDLEEAERGGTCRHLHW